MIVDSSFPQTSVIHTMITNRETVRFTVYCSHIATWIALIDVPANTGFCVVPGSHKSSFQTPKNLPVKHDPPTSITIPLQAGDMIVFSTNLLHDASPWTEDYPRMNIFQRYQLSVYFNETGKEGYPLEEYRHQISAEQYELESLSKEEKVAVYRASIGSST